MIICLETKHHGKAFLLTVSLGDLWRNCIKSRFQLASSQGFSLKSFLCECIAIALCRHSTLYLFEEISVNAKDYGVSKIPFKLRNI